MGNRFQVLSLDGGGLKGIFSAAILAHIEEDLNISITDYFDLIIGTSTGGIIALGLGAGMKPRDIIRFYINEGPKIFPKKTLPAVTKYFHTKYKSIGLRKSLQECFKEKRLADSTKRLVIPSYNIGDDDIYLFKTPHQKRLTRDYKVPMWKVAMATSAAPTFLPSFQEIDNIRLIDGGVWANNPTMIGIIEAMSLSNVDVDIDDIKVFSLGTTNPVVDRSSKLDVGGYWQWRNDAIEVILRGQSTGSYTQAMHLIGKENILRVNPKVPDNLFALDKLSEKELSSKAAHVSRQYSPIFKEKFMDHNSPEYKPYYR